MVFKQFSSDIIDLKKNFNTLNVATKEQIVDLNDLTDIFNEYKKAGKLKGNRYDSLLGDVDKLKNDNLTNYFKSIAEGAENARVNIVDAYAAILDGNTHGLKNVQSIFNTYNESLKDNEQGQKDFTKAVGQSNSALSGYLKTVGTTGKANLKDYAGYLAKTTAKTVGLQIASTALNAVISLGLSAAISGLVGFVSYLVNAEKEAIEKTSELADEIKQSVPEIVDLTTQYYALSNAVKSDITQKEALESVTQNLIAKLGLEGESIDFLIKKYGSLDKAINSITSKELEEAYSTLSVDYANKEKALKNAFSWDRTLKSKAGYNNYGSFSKTLKTIKESGLLSYDDVFTVDTLVFRNDFSTVENVKKNYEDLQKALLLLDETYGVSAGRDEFYQTLNQKKNELKDLIDEYDNAVVSLNQNIIQQNILNELSGKTLPQTQEEFDAFVNSVTDSTEGLAGIADGDFDTIKNAVESVLFGMSEFSSFFEDTVSSTNSATDAVYKFKEISEELKTTINDTFSNQSTFQSAFDKIQEGTSLTADEVRELVELCPSLADEFEKTADGWTIASQDLIDANDEMIKNTKDSIREQISNYQKLIDTYENSRESILNKTYLPSDALNAQLSNIPYTSEEVEEARKQIEFLNLTLSMFGLVSDNVVDKLDVLNKKYDEVSDTTSNIVNKAKSLSDAFAEQNENGSLSTETVLSLIENGYAAALMYDAETGAIRLNAQAYLDLANAEIEAQIAELTLAKNDAIKTALDEQRNIVSNLGWSYLDTAQAASEMAKAQEIISNANADVSNYDAQIKALEEHKKNLGDIIMGTYGGSGDTTDIWKAEFDSMYSEWKHKLALKQVTESEYIDWLDGAYKHYFSDLTKYQSEYWQYEEEVYSWRKEKEQELFDEKIENIEKLAEKTLDDDTDKSYGKYDKARKYYERAIITTQNRIQTLISSGTKDISDELDNLYDKLESYNDKIKEINNDEENQRISDETRYWEQLQDKVLTYYDEELKKLEDVESEQDKINRKEELRLEILEAENKLLEARENRNRLVFENGGFSYQADQAEIDSISAELSEKRKSLDEEIFSEKMDEQKSILQQQKDNAEKFFNSILQLLSNYEQKLSPVTNSDKTIVQSAIEWENTNKNISGTEENKIVKFISDALNMGLNTKDTMNYTLQMLSKAADSKIDTNINNYGNLSANDGLKLNNLFTDYNNSSNETINNIKNNTNNQNITFGDMHFDIQCGDSNNIKQSVSEAFEEFSNSFRSELTHLTYGK